MKRNILLVSALALSTTLAGAAYAADQAASAPAPVTQESPARKAADRDALKLSSDGANAFRDLSLARFALFNADPAQAKILIGKAEASFAKARTDDAVFVKAEADLHPPGKAAPVQPSADAAKPVSWVPIDGQLILGEGFVATPQKTAAITDAKTSLSAGDRAGAVETLKLAGVDVDFTMAVVPLDRTAADLGQAAALLDKGQYYQANVILKQAEDGVRFDMIDLAAVPQKVAALIPAHQDPQAASASGTAKPAAR